jgi:uncharacterized protein (DUF433 family)
MNWRERIERDPGTPHREPHVRGTDIAVSVVLHELVVHKDFQGVVACHPGLSEDDVGACVAWAAECAHTAERSEGTPEVAGARRGQSQKAGFKDFLRSMPNVGDDADFERPVDHGRPEVEWDS